MCDVRAVWQPSSPLRDEQRCSAEPVVLFTKWWVQFNFLGEIALAQPILTTHTPFFVACVVRLSVCRLSVTVGHIRSPCLNGSTNSRVVCRYTCEVQGHIVSDGSSGGREGSGVQNLAPP